MIMSKNDDGSLNYTELNHGDIKGYFPKSLMNMVIANEVYQSYKQMTQCIKERQAAK